MGMDSRDEMDRSMLSAESREKFDELVAVLAKEKYDSGRPPIDTTFAEIEDFGHQAGRMLGRSLDEHLAQEHGEHFAEACCPTYGAWGDLDALKSKKARPLQTQDGKLPLTEPAFHCPRCDRDFFPSADPPTIGDADFSCDGKHRRRSDANVTRWRLHGRA